ncbi:hypothetical protein Bhyg_11598 [Pseudolycoriella hygida]|uniref:Uncharacterized protein n=1 Tax=Pseudolycoriella hygida TaxID=35572 RepID=A0A9Q0MVV0_9DIPT|nr:hypothetical protein Bhyg_11598 [Pseudolycoriella hygida]
MKYPQLVSARAVNAISDWLVTRLEQLGIDAPLVYSRLLLSLLHTPLQINALDLAEISDNNIGIIGRKNNRRFSSSDVEAIKRIAAIESLIEVVATDQKVSNVEKLVDDLCEKLREIEGQQNCMDESQYIDSTAIETAKKPSSPEDPAKRYYRAFPALSKDFSSDKAVPIAPQPLTWPLNGGNSVKSGNYSIGSSSTAGVKRKPKRRRNQAMSRGKTTSNREYSDCSWDTDFEGSWEMGRDLIREFVMTQNNRNRSISESDANTCGEVKDMKKNVGAGASNMTPFDENLMHNDEDICIDYTIMSADHDAFGRIINVPETKISQENITCPSLSEIEGSLSAPPRRLYERNVSNEWLNKSIQDANTLASFEAKFTGIEAIWNDCDAYRFRKSANSPRTFWSNYQRHCYNNDNQHENQSLLSHASEEADHVQHIDEFEEKMERWKYMLDQRFAGVSIAINSDQPAMKPDSIWSNQAGSEDDGSFYANAMWNSAVATENLLQSSQANNVEGQSNDFCSSSCFRHYDMSTASKWSDCSTLETPFVPPPSSTSSTRNLSTYHDMLANTEDKIRNNLLENSYYYYDYQSEASEDSMNFNRYRPQTNTHFYHSHFQMDEATDVAYPHNDMATQMNRSMTTVTLPNHSENSRFAPVKPSNGRNRVNYLDQMKPRDGRIMYPQQVATPKVEEENLLTSERTHFRPIMSYQDGFSFDIPDTLDDVKFSRSESGAMHLNDDKYMEYNPRGSDDDEDFKVKFCVRQNDKSCQTDDISLDRFSFHDRCGYVCDEPSSLPELIELDDFNSSFGLCEEIDSYSKTNVNLDMENWTMGGSGRQCGHGLPHSLWQHCSGCSCDIASKPANQMMKDELCADGEEIMSDLRSMYIGSDLNGDDVEEEEINDNEVDGNSDAYKEELDDGGVATVTVEPNNLLSNVSKLISDLLMPETARSLVDVINSNFIEEMSARPPFTRRLVYTDESEKENEAKSFKSEKRENDECNNNSSKKFLGGLFGDSATSTVWRGDSKRSTEKYITVVREIDDWEHNNVERIWATDEEDSSPQTIAIYNIPDDANENFSPRTIAIYKKPRNVPIANDFILDCGLALNNLTNEFNKRFIGFKPILQLYNGNDNGNDDGLMILNRSDRKRRHSVSQSVSEAVVTMMDEEARRKLASMFNDEFDVTTIITCNYWTTDNSSYIGEI